MSERQMIYEVESGGGAGPVKRVKLRTSLAWVLAVLAVCVAGQVLCSGCGLLQSYLETIGEEEQIPEGETRAEAESRREYGDFRKSFPDFKLPPWTRGAKVPPVGFVTTVPLYGGETPTNCDYKCRFSCLDCLGCLCFLDASCPPGTFVRCCPPK
jgi:hypothetical protein